MRSKKAGIFPCFDVFDTLSFLAFCLSVPLLLPVFQLWRAMDPASSVSGASLFSTVAFANALPLSAMFTALAFLFICLLKTAHARVSRAIMVLALACYAGGYVLLWSLQMVDGALVEAASGLMLGFGAAVMCMVWVSRLQVLEFKRALLVVWLAACCLFGGAVVLSLAGPTLAKPALTAAAALSLVGCARLFFRLERGEGPHAQHGVNWWDVFGHLDISVVEGTGDFQAPFARALFVAVMPFAMLLLFVSGNDLAHQIHWAASPLAVAGVLAVVALAPLLRFKSDQALINFSYRFYLPIVAFAVFAASAFVQPPLQRSVMVVGSFVFCAIYAFVMSAMFAVMAGRMKSLALPAADIMIIVGSLVCLLSNARVDPEALGAYQYPVLIVLFVVLAAVFMVTPSSRLWHVVLEGIDAAESSAFDSQEGYARRCAELADRFGLTARESEILLLLGRGHTASYVAEALTVAESTVRSHRKNMYRKLEVSSREELFKLIDADGSVRSQDIR